jgi:hypothetical protein
MDMYKTGPRKWEWADVVRIPLSIVAVTSWLWVLLLVPESWRAPGAVSDGMAPFQFFAFVGCMVLLVGADKVLTKLTRRFTA